MNNLEDEIRAIVTHMENQENQEQDTNTAKPREEIQDVYVLIVRVQEEAEEAPDNTQVVDSIAAIPQKISFLPVYAVCLFYLFLIFSTLAFKLYCIVNPPIATITIIPKSQTVTLTGTLHLGRLLNPITISQSQTTPTTGKGHQIAKAATGTVTFYNGLFTQQFVASGTVYTGNDGVEIDTTQDAIIPKGNPSSGYGTATVTAQAGEAGSKGNIQAGDVSITINNGLLVRNNQFHNGQDERTYATVTQKDIHIVSTVLKTTLAQSITGALQGQLTPQEQLYVLPCTPNVTSDHPIGTEATQVKVIVSETCSAAAYNRGELAQKATDLISRQAIHTVGAGYSLLGDTKVTVTQATIPTTHTKQVILSFHAQGTWIYGLSYKAQQQIKRLIAGKTTQQAVTLLSTLPGVESAAIRFTGFGDDTRLPKNTGYIHLTIFVV